MGSKLVDLFLGSSYYMEVDSLEVKSLDYWFLSPTILLGGVLEGINSLHTLHSKKVKIGTVRGGEVCV